MSYTKSSLEIITNQSVISINLDHAYFTQPNLSLGKIGVLSYQSIIQNIILHKLITFLDVKRDSLYLNHMGQIVCVEDLLSEELRKNPNHEISSILNLYKALHQPCSSLDDFYHHPAWEDILTHKTDGLIIHQIIQHVVYQLDADDYNYKFQLNLNGFNLKRFRRDLHFKIRNLYITYKNNQNDENSVRFTHPYLDDLAGLTSIYKHATEEQKRILQLGHTQFISDGTENYPITYEEILCYLRVRIEAVRGREKIMYPQYRISTRLNDLVKEEMMDSLDFIQDGIWKQFDLQPDQEVVGLEEITYSTDQEGKIKDKLECHKIHFGFMRVVVDNFDPYTE